VPFAKDVAFARHRAEVAHWMSWDTMKNRFFHCFQPLAVSKKTFIYHRDTEVTEKSSFQKTLCSLVRQAKSG